MRDIQGHQAKTAPAPQFYTPDQMAMVPEMLRLPQDQIEQRKAAFQGNNKLEYGNFGDLPDDDPATRDGGLDPSNKDDWHQLQLLVGQRQSGMLSDKAWQRVMQRNPKTSTLLSSMTAKPEKDGDPYKNMAAKAAAIAAGIPLNKPQEEWSPKDAQEFFKYYSPWTMAQVPGGVIPLPRGQMPGRIDNPTPVPPKLLEELGDRSATYEKMKNIRSSFSDDYSGFGSDTLGQATVEWKKRFGDASDTEFANWWQSYKDYANDVRHKLFGSALTATEKKEFEDAMVTPGMKPELVKRNLARQERAVLAAARKLTRGAAANTGYNQNQIREAVGGSPEILGNGDDEKADPLGIRGR